MSPSSTSRLALAISLVSLVVALVPRCTSDGESRRGAKVTDPAGWVEESACKNEALAADIEELRNEISALSTPAQRDTLGPEGSYAGAPFRGAGGGEFEVRRALLQGFQRLESGDRKDALERLAELARWGDPEAMAMIARSLGDSSASVRAKALEELVDVDAANKAVHLRAALGDSSPKVREVVADHLDEVAAEQAGPMLVGLLRDPDRHVVAEAIESLGDLEFAQARPMLVEQLQAQSLDVATSAARALMKIGNEAAPPGTIQRILADYAGEDVWGRVEDVKRLRRLRAVGPLENILATDPSLAVREEAREALASIGD